MKRIICAAFVAVLAMGVFASSAMAVNSQPYTLVVPRFGGSEYSSYKTVYNGKHFGTFHRYSGGKSVIFQPMYSAATPAGPSVLVSPGGPSAPWTRLWYNGSGSAKSIMIRLKTLTLTPVDVLAQGTWYWNL